MDRGKLTELIEASDLDGLIRFVDGVCAAKEYAGLVEVRERCAEAVERGKEVWGIAHFAAYRLALEAPGPLAASVIEEGAGRMGLGPLWEVAASTHSWEELGSYIGADRMRSLVGYERAIRGDSLPAGLEEVLGLPIAQQSWEPIYPVATYRADGADFPSPDPVPMTDVTRPGASRAPIEDAESDDALFELVRTWVDESNGTFAATATEGSAEEAISLLAPDPVKFTEVRAGMALAQMAWAGASGGAAGTRRGMAVGRANAWAAVVALADIEWPGDPAAIGAALGEFRWLIWEAQGRVGGWSLHLAVEHPQEGIAWAVAAHDVQAGGGNG